MPRVLPGKFVENSTAFVKPSETDKNGAILESERLCFLVEPIHQKKFDHKLEKFKTSVADLDYPYQNSSAVVPGFRKPLQK